MSSHPDNRVRRRRRRALVIGIALFALILAALGVRFGPLVFERNEYRDVQSIELRPDFRDATLMAAAWQLPAAAEYAKHPLEYQRNPSFCGPASAANVMRSLGISTTQSAVIDGTSYDPLFGILPGGMTLDELASLLDHRLDYRVVVLRDLTLEEFRQEIQKANDPRRRYIVNFHRGPLFGRGHGHFSPVLGYLAEADLVAVGDVNESYKPFLVATDRLWQGVDTHDNSSGQKRGLIVVVTGE